MCFLDKFTSIVCCLVMSRENLWRSSDWVLDTDKTMSKGPNNADNPYVWLKIEAIGTFQEPENVKMLSPKIFEFFSSEANVEKEQLLVNFYNLEATHVGSMGTTVAELRK